MSNEDIATLDAIRTYGGSFMRALGRAYSVADDINQQKIKRTWAAEWRQYEEQAMRLLSQEERQHES